MRSASMSRPLSVSSRMLRRGSLAAAEALVHRAAGQLVVELHHGTLFTHELKEVAGTQRLLAMIAALLVDGGTHEVDHRHARYLDRILEAEEQSLVGAVLGRQSQQVFSVELHLTTGDGERRMPREHRTERALAAAVGSHDGVYLTRAHGQIDALQYLLAFDRGM